MLLFCFRSVLKGLVVGLEDSVHLRKTSVDRDAVDEGFGHAVGLVVGLMQVLDVEADLVVFLSFGGAGTTGRLCLVLEGNSFEVCVRMGRGLLGGHIFFRVSCVN
jgi:hypothetical protein